MICDMGYGVRDMEDMLYMICDMRCGRWGIGYGVQNRVAWDTPRNHGPYFYDPHSSNIPYSIFPDSMLQEPRPHTGSILSNSILSYSTLSYIIVPCFTRTDSQTPTLDPSFERAVSLTGQPGFRVGRAIWVKHNINNYPSKGTA